MRAILATLLLAVFFVATAPAQTAPNRHHQRHVAHYRVHPHHAARQVREAGGDVRPAQWCGWFMRQVFHVADRAYNWAPNWAHWGHPLPGPQVGAVVVWRGHVGLIEGGPDKRGRWLVESGNDGHAVRTRYLSITNAIAFRMP
jgi:hypothetical protein